MKKSTLILFLLILTKQLFSQVAIFIDFSISENKVILFGPQNVSRYFDEQAASYILKYKEFETIIKNELAAVALDLEKQESKKIRNLTQIGKLEQEIGHYYLKLELLTEFISAWESHQDSYLRFKNDFSSIFNGDSCYCFEHGGLELCTDEITIEKSDSNADLNYDQFIKDEMKTIALRLKPGVEPIKKTRNPSYSYRLLNSEISELIILETSLQERLHKTIHDPRNPAPDLTNEITDQNIETVEYAFQPLIYDTEKNELYLEIQFKSEKESIQIINNETGLSIIPEKWFLINCNE